MFELFWVIALENYVTTFKKSQIVITFVILE